MLNHNSYLVLFITILLQMDESSLVVSIDSRLRFESDLGKGMPCFTSVYKVFFENDSYVLKLAPWNDPDAINHLQNEEETLKLASNIKNISHLIKKYETNTHFALLKEYTKGSILKSLKKKISDYHLKNSLIKTVTELHDIGIVGIDLFSQNIVVANDNSYVKIVDLGASSFSKGLSKTELEEKLSEDEMLLRRLFS